MGTEPVAEDEPVADGAPLLEAKPLPDAVPEDEPVPVAEAWAEGVAVALADALRVHPAPAKTPSTSTVEEPTKKEGDALALRDEIKLAVACEVACRRRAAAKKGGAAAAGGGGAAAFTTARSGGAEPQGSASNRNAKITVQACRRRGGREIVGEEPFIRPLKKKDF